MTSLRRSNLLRSSIIENNKNIFVYPNFIFVASFQETTRVLAKIVLQNLINWLKGLKENVVFGGMIPIGIGFNRITELSKNLCDMLQKSFLKI
ncbi:hypothetical protein Ahy_A04g019803 [Arachis hypogaea]|uniref:DNA-directed RNA polymerase n=1 Tax=Arachis hypogaea TaxID=3818 RepID=A0A445DGK8_ARAHY|nr:hypothetical protein Ahy_A04g019803 [Arachis hypogaea]